MIATNAIIQFKHNDSVVRARLLYADNEISYLIDIDSNRLPYSMSTSDLVTQLDTGNATYISDFISEYAFLFDDEISPESIAVRDKYYSILEPLISKIMVPDIYIKKQLSPLIREVAEYSGLSNQTILNKLKKYWREGFIKNALLPDFYKCGAKGKPRKSSAAKRGRPRKFGDNIGINIDNQIKRIFKIGLNKYYYTSAKKSLMNTYELILRDYFSEDVDGVIKLSDNRPTYNQFRYWFNKERDIKRQITSRESSRKFLKDHKSITGDSSSLATGPGYYEIDGQVGDLYLVSEYNRSKIVGRPSITILVDRYSRLIGGLYVGLEVNSYINSMMALKNLSEDKIEFCRSMGISIKNEQWPSRGLPKSVIADRGELKGVTINNYINKLGVNVEVLPPYAGQMKPFVERTHGIINSLIKPYLTGVVDSDTRERGATDYRLKATLTLNEFRKIVVMAVLHYNSSHALSNFKSTEDIIKDQVELIPSSLYRYGLSKYGHPRVVSENQLKLALLPTKVVKISGKGIKLHGQYYVSDVLLKTGKYVEAREKSINTEVYFDPRDLNIIYSVEENRIIEHHLNQELSVSYEELEFFNNLRYENEVILNEQELSSKLSLVNDIESIVNKSIKLKKEVSNPNATKIGQTRGIRDNRRVEIELSQKDDVIGFDDLDVDPLDLIKMKQDEVLHD